MRFKLYPRGMALASVCIAIVLATPLLLGTASADTGHMHPGPQRELDRSFAVARHHALPDPCCGAGYLR